MEGVEGLLDLAFGVFGGEEKAETGRALGNGGVEDGRSDDASIEEAFGPGEGGDGASGDDGGDGSSRRSAHGQSTFAGTFVEVMAAGLETEDTRWFALE